MKKQNMLDFFSNQHPYFWNALFICLYDADRRYITIEALAQKVHSNRATVYNKLACSQILTYDEFLLYCKAVPIKNIETENFQVLKYSNMALTFLQMLDDNNPKLTSSSKFRAKTLSEIEEKQDDCYIQEMLDETLEIYYSYVEQTIIQKFQLVSPDDLAYLYEIANILPYINNYDELFLKLYLKLNKLGKSLFLEKLESEKTDASRIYEDDTIKIFNQTSSIKKNDCIQRITPSMLTEHLNYLQCYSLEHAECLCLFSDMNEEVWNALISFHKISLTYPEESIEGANINSNQALLFFLEELGKIPSLQI